MKYILSTLIAAFVTMYSFAQWTTITNTGNGFVDDFEVFNNELYATGFFTTFDGTSANYVAKYNGTTWEAVGSGFPDAGHHLEKIDNDLYGVAYQPSVDSNWLYLFDGTNFNAIGEGVYLTTATSGFSNTANLYDVIKYDGQVVVCGEFDRVGAAAISGIAQWDGTQMSPLGSGLSGNIQNTAPVMYPHDMCLFGNDLIVGGNFLNAGGQQVNGIAKWDGTQWSPMGQGLNGTVYGVCEYNGELYAGGDFTASGTTSLKYIAKWNGTDWIDPGFYFEYESTSNYTFIHTITELAGKLFVAGGFDRAIQGQDTMICSGIGLFENGVVDSLSGGIANNQIEAATIFNGQLYVGGGVNNSTSYVGIYGSLVSTDPFEPIDNTISLFPNPSNGEISIDNLKIGSEILIHDELGRLILAETANQSQINFTLNLTGVYIVTIKSKSDLQRKKLVVN